MKEVSADVQGVSGELFLIYASNISLIQIFTVTGNFVKEESDESGQ